MKQDKASTLHTREDRLSCVCNKEQNTNKDTFPGSRIVRLCSDYICQAAHAPVAQPLKIDTEPQQTAAAPLASTNRQLKLGIVVGIKQNPWRPTA
jgi:hypothetical protein